MTGRGVVNLIDSLEAKGIEPAEIIRIIKYIELADPHTKTISDKEPESD